MLASAEAGLPPSAPGPLGVGGGSLGGADNPAPQLDKVASTLGLLANESRLQILCFLSRGDRSVSEIVEALDGKFSAVSQQLKILTLGGLLLRHRRGRNIYYRLNDPLSQTVLRLIHELMEG